MSIKEGAAPAGTSQDLVSYPVSERASRLRSPLPEGIPSALRDTPRWVAWRQDPPLKPGGKPRKVPINPSTGALASVTDPTTWSSFEGALQRMRDDGLAGIGFVLTDADNIVCVDLDACINVETGEVQEHALRLVSRFASFVETSASGTGIHIWLRGALPPGRNRSGNFEVYARDRFIAVTGQLFDPRFPSIEERGEVLAKVFHEVFGKQPGKKPAAPVAPRAASAVPEDDHAVLKRAFASKKGSAIEALYRGELNGHASQSEADLALCAHLAFWTDGDSVRMDRIFRASGLFRAKWDERRGESTYGAQTISKALEGHTPRRRPKQKTASGPVRQFALTDIGNAERLVHRFGHDIRFVSSWGWVRWNGRYWTSDESRGIELLAKQTVRAILTEEAADPSLSDLQRDELIKHALRSEGDPRIRALLARAIPERPALVSDFDRDPFLLNIENGTLDLRTGTLREHRRDDMCTKLAPVVFDPDAVCLDLDSFFEFIAARDVEFRAMLDRLFGYILTGDTREDKFGMLVGPGGGGKTTLLEMLRSMLGPYAASLPFECLLSREGDGGGPRPELARCVGARLVTASEVEEGRKFNASTIKAIVGGETVTVHAKYKDPFEFKPQFKLLLAANCPPRFLRGDDDDAARRRLLVLPFNQQPEQVDQNLRQRLQEPDARSALLAIAVRGCLDWQARGLVSCAAVSKATAAYWGDVALSDCFERFLVECCVREPAASAPSSDLYAAFQVLQEADGQPLMSQKLFGRTLEARGFCGFQAGGGTRMRRGLRLVSASEGQ